MDPRWPISEVLGNSIALARQGFPSYSRIQIEIVQATMSESFTNDVKFHEHFT